MDLTGWVVAIDVKKMDRAAGGTAYVGKGVQTPPPPKVPNYDVTIMVALRQGLHSGPPGFDVLHIDMRSTA
jgi:hypothetical protein